MTPAERSAVAVMSMYGAAPVQPVDQPLWGVTGGVAVSQVLYSRTLM